MAYLKPQISWHFFRLHMGGNIDADDLGFRVRDDRLHFGATRQGTHLAIRIFFGDIESPSSRTIATVQDPFRVFNRWENESLVEDVLENSVLFIQTFTLNLRTNLSITSARKRIILVPHRPE